MRLGEDGEKAGRGRRWTGGVRRGPVPHYLGPHTLETIPNQMLILGNP